MNSKEIMVLPGVSVCATITADINLPNGKQIHVSMYDIQKRTVTGDAGIEPAVAEIAQEVRVMASKRHLRRNACAGKRRHSTKERAPLALHNGGQAYDGCHVYYCTSCRAWHVGHPMKYRSRQPAKWRWDRGVAA